MDALVAAAGVVDMTLDANAEEDLGQHSSCATVGVGDAHMLDVEASAEDKQNTHVYAAAGNPEDAPSEVPNALPILLRTRLLHPLLGHRYHWSS